MKYVITWSVRSSTSEELQARGLQVFSKWSPADSVNFQQFLGRVDGQGGFAVVETDDPSAVAKDMATFSPFFDFHVYPVMDIQDTAQLTGEAIQFRQSIT